MVTTALNEQSIDDQPQIGSITVVCGPMFAGKTSYLIRLVKELRGKGRFVYVLKHGSDARYDRHSLASHDGFKLEAHALRDIASLSYYVPQYVDTLVIDEAQFFDSAVVDFAKQMRDGGRHVVLAGLELDFRGEPFGAMLQLLALSDSVTKLTAKCAVCGGTANRTQRLVNGVPARYDDPVVVIGAAECYQARCLEHHEVWR